MTTNDLFIIFFLGLTAIAIIITLVCLWVSSIKAKRWERWCNAIYSQNPLLRDLLSKQREYWQMREDLSEKLDTMTAAINGRIEAIKFIPRERHAAYEKVTEMIIKDRIKIIKRRTEASERYRYYNEQLKQWWAYNHPEVPEEKRIMWWDN